MRRIRWRYALPACNVAIDLILVGILVTQHREYDRYSRTVYADSLERVLERRLPGAPGIRRKDVPDRRAAEFSAPPSQPYYATIIGTAPAAMLSTAVISVPLREMLGRRLDVKWFLVHEILAMWFWLAAGLLAESASRRWRVSLLAFIALRLLSAVLSTQAGGTFSRGFEVCSVALGAAWMAAAACVAVAGSRRLLVPVRMMF